MLQGVQTIQTQCYIICINAHLYFQIFNIYPSNINIISSMMSYYLNGQNKQIRSQGVSLTCALSQSKIVRCETIFKHSASDITMEYLEPLNK